jgi:hypothetical protein
MPLTHACPAIDYERVIDPVAPRPTEPITLRSLRWSAVGAKDPPICAARGEWRHGPRHAPIWVIGVAADARSRP